MGTKMERRQLKLQSQGKNTPERKGETAMASLPANFFFFLLTLVLILSPCLPAVDGGRRSKQREFDYFVLALQWPGTVCRTTRRCCSFNACCRRSGAPSEFTIHGFWPDYNDGYRPACCTNSRFDIKEVSNLLGALKNYWPSLSCGSPYSCSGHRGSFWAYEWEKHGTCSYPVTSNVYDFFLTTLNIYFKYNVTKVLNEAGYVPSNSKKYPVGGIISTIENASHASPLVVCSQGAIKELRLCFYKNFMPRDCVAPLERDDVLISSESSCPRYVSLPIYTPFRLRKGNREVPVL